MESENDFHNLLGQPAGNIIRCSDLTFASNKIRYIMNQLLTHDRSFVYTEFGPGKNKASLRDLRVEIPRTRESELYMLGEMFSYGFVPDVTDVYTAFAYGRCMIAQVFLAALVSNQTRHEWFDNASAKITCALDEYDKNVFHNIIMLLLQRNMPNVAKYVVLRYAELNGSAHIILTEPIANERQQFDKFRRGIDALKKVNISIIVVNN